MLNENEVVEATCLYLESRGFKIEQRCSTTAHGIDIIARTPIENRRLLIEAKGGTSSRSGSARFEKGFNRSQVFDRVAKGFYTAACMLSAACDSGDRVGMAFPDTELFRDYIGRGKAVLDRLEIVVYLVRADCSVIEL